MAKCAHCPIFGPCRGESPGWEFVCGKVPEGDGSFLAWLRLASGDAPNPQPARPTATETIGLLKRTRAYRHRSAPSCSCAYARCALAGKDVAAQTCLACVGGEMREQGVESIALPAPPHSASAV